MISAGFVIYVGDALRKVLLSGYGKECVSPLNTGVLEAQLLVHLAPFGDCNIML